MSVAELADLADLAELGDSSSGAECRDRLSYPLRSVVRMGPAGRQAQDRVAGGFTGLGKLGRQASSVVDEVAGLVEGFDPELTGARDAMDLVAVFSRLEHLASAGVALAGRRVAQTNLWRAGGHRSAAHWLAQATGMSVGDAVRLLQAAEAVEAAPETREALRSGEVSVRQAKAIGAAEAVDPDAGQRLLAVAGDRSAKELEDESARVVRAAARESESERALRHHKARRVFHGVNADGMGYGGWLAPIAEHTRIVAAIEGERTRVFREARAAGGERESVEAHAADALCRIIDRATHPATGAGGAPGATTGDRVQDSGADRDDWSFAKVIVRVDLNALDRGRVESGEVCEIAGRGPMPVTDAWHMIDGDAFVAAVTTRGTEIDRVVHLGRRPTVLQRTALEWYSAGECSIEGCTNPARIEMDHVHDWADSKVTALPQLATPCGHHHDLKTHHGYTFGARLPTGKRRLIPPDGLVLRDPPPPSTGPPGPRTQRSDGSSNPRLSEQQSLLDTG